MKTFTLNRTAGDDFDFNLGGDTDTGFCGRHFISLFPKAEYAQVVELVVSDRPTFKPDELIVSLVPPPDEEMPLRFVKVEGQSVQLTHRTAVYFSTHFTPGVTYYAHVEKIK